MYGDVWASSTGPAKNGAEKNNDHHRMNILAILRDSAGTGKADQTHLIIQEGP
jgi:hypothetical protein